MKKTVHDEPAGPLKEYRRKRNFSQTAEPAPQAPKKRAAKELMFVIQKHDATRLHYDFRLEMQGVLKSWAVPKGLPATKGDKRLAVHVEDHPMDYARFEGTIPEGNYGAGTVMVWDIGTYCVKDADPIKALDAGKLHVILKGNKLKGEWALIRLKRRAGEDKDNWLIFKAGEEMKPLSAKKDDESVLSKRSMRKIADENKAEWKSDRRAGNIKSVDPRIAAAVARRKAAVSVPSALTAKKGRKGAAVTHEKLKELPLGGIALEKLPPAKLQFVEPMKCKFVENPPRGEPWIYEIKFDGFRALALKEGSNVQLLSRSNKSLNDRFPEIAKAIAKLPFKSGMLDGEIVALDEQGRSSFQLLQMANMVGQERSSLCFYAFDLLNLEGKDLKTLPLRQRKEILQPLISAEHEAVRFSANIEGDPQRLLEEIKRRGLEGIIAKNLDSKYEAGHRSGCWKKIKVINAQEFVIGGYTQPKGSRDFFGAILVGYFEDDKLMFVSKVGTGFNQALLGSLHKQFERIQRDECPFVNLPETRRGHFGQGITKTEMKRCKWVEPKLVCQISFTEWTRDNHLRNPVFLGLREDKVAAEVRKEIAVPGK
ncbi:MAG: ATP-dependent DNA ligase [Verrucomicrobia bacterium]|nr:ATP-dependent DNA ligase [Verrucomicrobiota bacterium]